MGGDGGAEANVSGCGVASYRDFVAAPLVRAGIFVETVVY